MKFVTMTDNEFVPGVLALIQSLKENSGFDENEIEIVILELEDLKKENKDNLKNFNLDLTFYKSNKLGKFKFDSDLVEKNHHIVTLQKFLIYKLPYDEKMCYLDADLICLSDVTKLSELKPISAGINIGSGPPPTINNYIQFSSGMFVFKPSLRMYEEIQEFANDYNQKLKRSDLSLMNEFYYRKYPESINLLGLEWHIPITLKRFHPREWSYVKKKGIRFLHYTTSEGSPR